MFDSLKKEAERRKYEKKELEAAIKKEKEELAAKRDAAEKNILRKKVKVVDRMATAHEDHRDEKHLAEFRAEQTKKVEQARAERRNQMVSRNRDKFIAGGVGIVVVAIVACLVGGHIQNQQVMEDYNAAVGYILEGDYSDAKATLGEISEEDAENTEGADDVDALTQYAEAQMNIDDCTGHPSRFVKSLENVGEIENKEVSLQQEEAMIQTKSAEKVQGKINSLDYVEITPDSKEELDEISAEMSQIDDRYQGLVDDSRLENAEGMIDHMEKKDAPGKVMLAISKIDKVTLDSKSSLKKIRDAYTELTDSNQKKVLNYSALTAAESKLSSLEKRKKEEEEKARKEAEEKAERERLKAERQQEEAEDTSERVVPDEDNSRTVYCTPTGKCYHYLESCPRSDNVYPISEDEASRFLRPCKKCVH